MLKLSPVHQIYEQSFHESVVWVLLKLKSVHIVQVLGKRI